MNSFGNNLISFVVIHDTEERTHKSTDMFEKGSYCYSLQARKKNFSFAYQNLRFENAAKRTYEFISSHSLSLRLTSS